MNKIWQAAIKGLIEPYLAVPGIDWQVFGGKIKDLMDELVDEIAETSSDVITNFK